MPVTFPREPTGDDGINPADIASAIMGLRFDRIQSMKFEVRPSIGMVAKDIQRLGLDIRSFKEPLSRAIKLVIIPSIRKNFQVGGRPEWDPLAEATIKARNFSAWPILVRTGKLQRRATQLNIWDISMTSATVRSLPADAFYGVYHQAGTGGTLHSKIMNTRPGSAEAKKLLAPLFKRAMKELPGASDARIKARVQGYIADETWELPQRQFIMYQDDDIPRIQEIFVLWMTERARRVGRFVDE